MFTIFIIVFELLMLFISKIKTLVINMLLIITYD